MASERRLTFGSVAELYDRARPSYPEALVDDVLSYARVGRGDRALEIGAGTGKATRLFAQRGLRVLALEPDPQMAGVAAERLASFARVKVERSEFESWQPSEPYPLVFSAQAWHWVRPEVRYRLAREALVEGGGLALFWNRPAWDRAPLRDELDRVYARLGPPAGGQPGPMQPGAVQPEHWMTDWDEALGRQAGLGDLDHRLYSWQAGYTAREYVDLLRTHSDHIVLEPARREALLAAVAEVIDAQDGSFELPYITRLLLARAVG